MSIKNYYYSPYQVGFNQYSPLDASRSGNNLHIKEDSNSQNGISIELINKAKNNTVQIAQKKFYYDDRFDENGKPLLKYQVEFPNTDQNHFLFSQVSKVEEIPYQTENGETKYRVNFYLPDYQELKKIKAQNSYFRDMSFSSAHINIFKVIMAMQNIIVEESSLAKILAKPGKATQGQTAIDKRLPEFSKIFADGLMLNKLSPNEQKLAQELGYGNKTHSARSRKKLTKMYGGNKSFSDYLQGIFHMKQDELLLFERDDNVGYMSRVGRNALPTSMPDNVDLGMEIESLQQLADEFKLQCVGRHNGILVYAVVASKEEVEKFYTETVPDFRKESRLYKACEAFETALGSVLYRDAGNGNRTIKDCVIAAPIPDTIFEDYRNDTKHRLPENLRNWMVHTKRLVNALMDIEPKVEEQVWTKNEAGRQAEIVKRLIAKRTEQLLEEEFDETTKD